MIALADMLAPVMEGINIATFHLGRAEQGGYAICPVSFDGQVPEDVLAMLRTLSLVMQATPLAF